MDNHNNDICKFEGMSLENFKPENNSYIVLRYDLTKTRFDQCCRYVEYLADNFPNNKVIGIPNETSIETMNKEQLDILVKHIKEFQTN